MASRKEEEKAHGMFGIDPLRSTVQHYTKAHWSRHLVIDHHAYMGRYVYDFMRAEWAHTNTHTHSGDEVITLAMGFATSFGGLLVSRLLLG